MIMGFQTKQILEGCGIGLLAGLVIGYSEADWLRLAIVLALIGLSARTFAVETKEATFATRVASIGLSAFFAVFLGLYLHGSELFEAFKIIR